MKLITKYLLSMVTALVMAVIMLYSTNNLPEVFKSQDENSPEKFRETMTEFMRVVRNQQSASLGAKNMLYLAILKAEDNFNTASVLSSRRTFRTQAEYLERVPTILLQFSEGAADTMEYYRINRPEDMGVYREGVVKDFAESIAAHYPR